ncbi:MAG: hypothetical protein Q4B42_06055, partial [Oscillospiraceae bacterium]|nr:hypothetical protein [Oscillospiraceae bacterium]
LTELYSLIQLSLFNTTSNPRVVVGQEGWLFYNNYDADDNPVSDLLGQNEFTEEDIQKIRENISAAQDACPEAQFILLIVPNKENIYKEKLPVYLLEEAVEKTRVDLLCERLCREFDCLVYPKAALEEASLSWQTYYKYDTHWNLLGGYIGFREACAAADAELPALELLEVSFTDDEYPKDLAALAGIQNRVSDDSEISIKGFNADVEVSCEDLGGGVSLFRSNAADERSVLFVHDSFYKSMEPWMPLVFSEVISVDRDYYDLYGCHSLIDEYSPDIILMEVAERGAILLLHEDMPY